MFVKKGFLQWTTTDLGTGRVFTGALSNDIKSHDNQSATQRIYTDIFQEHILPSINISLIYSLTPICKIERNLLSI